MTDSRLRQAERAYEAEPNAETLMKAIYPTKHRSVRSAKYDFIDTFTGKA